MRANKNASIPTSLSTPITYTRVNTDTAIYFSDKPELFCRIIPEA